MSAFSRYCCELILISWFYLRKMYGPPCQRSKQLKSSFWRRHYAQHLYENLCQIRNLSFPYRFTLKFHFIVLCTGCRCCCRHISCFSHVSFRLWNAFCVCVFDQRFCDFFFILVCTIHREASVSSFEIRLCIITITRDHFLLPFRRMADSQIYRIRAVTCCYWWHHSQMVHRKWLAQNFLMFHIYLVCLSCGDWGLRRSDSNGSGGGDSGVGRL